MREEKVPATLNLQQAMTEANRCLHCFDAPCQKACPANVPVPQFIRRIATEDFEGAAASIVKENPFGATCARVCPFEQLCQKECSDKKLAKGIQIASLQAFAMGYKAEKPKDIKANGKKVAVVGAGPCGLAATHFLAKAGCAVTLYEQGEVLGGVPRLQIPNFRLEESCMPSEIEDILALGVQVCQGTKVDEGMAERLLQEYDAVYLAIGLGKKNASLDMQQPGLRFAEDFLEDFNNKKVTAEDLGDHVFVIGGGNTAMDAASAAKVLGAKEVTVLYRRTVQEMPAWEREYNHALALGVGFEWQTLVLDLQVENGALKALKTAPTQAGETGADGRKVMRANEEKSLVRDATCLISALGSKSDDALLSAFGLAKDANGQWVQPAGSKVFLGGDCLNGGSTVVQAVADGKRAAEEIQQLMNK